MWCSSRPSLGELVLIWYLCLAPLFGNQFSCRFGFAPRFSLLFHFSVLFLFQHLYYQIIVSSNRFWKQVMSLTFYFPQNCFDWSAFCGFIWTLVLFLLVLWRMFFVSVNYCTESVNCFGQHGFLVVFVFPFHEHIIHSVSACECVCAYVCPSMFSVTHQYFIDIMELFDFG